MAIVRAATNATRAELEDDLEGRATAFPTPKLALGLVKLLLDRVEFEAPGDEAPSLRKRAFDAGALALRSLPDDARKEELELALERHAPEALASLRARLYADLPESRRMLSFDDLEPRELLDRWNLAQAQGLVLRASSLEVRARNPEIKRVRRLLRWLRFCRLVADVRQDGDEWTIAVEGPAAILSMQKKYGLQLAQFVAAVPLLERWSLTAPLDFGRGRPVSLTLTDASPLRSPHDRALGWIPEEIDVIAKKFSGADEAWALDLTPVPRAVGVSGLCVPDFTFRHRTTGVEVSVEIFHRWHRHQLVRRLDELRTRPDPGLHLAVDESLLGEEGLRASVEASGHVLTFKQFPSERKLRALLATLEQGAPARGR